MAKKSAKTSKSKQLPSNKSVGKSASSGAARSAAKPGRSKQEQREATRRLLLKIAREEFVRHGFAGAATEKIVERARVTRGALYHQFKDKQDLFRAVFEEAQAEIVQAIGAAVEKATDGWSALIDGCRAFVATSASPGLGRIVLVDGPSVLGMEEWRRLDDEYSFQELMVGVGEAMKAGMLPQLPVEPLARALSGAMNEIVLYCAAAPDTKRAVRESQATIVEILEALRARVN